MPIDKAGRFTWQKQSSRWDVIQARRAFHAQASQKYLAAGQDAMNRLSGAFANQISGSAEIAARAAATRVQAAATARTKQALQGLDLST